MKYIFKLIKKLIIGVFLIYSVNILLANVSIYIPINVFTVFLSSFFGFFGIISIIVIKLII